MRFRPGNPLRSEAEAFRWVVAIGIAGATVIAVAKLISSTAGAFWGLFLVLIGLVAIWRAMEADVRAAISRLRGTGDHQRLLVLIGRAGATDGFLEEVRDHTEEDGEILLVAAVLGDGVTDEATNRDEGTELARQRMELAVLALRESQIRVRGQLGPRDLTDAVRAALEGFPASEVLVARSASLGSVEAPDSTVAGLESEAGVKVTIL